MASTDENPADVKMRGVVTVILMVSVVRFFSIGALYSVQADYFDNEFYPGADLHQVSGNISLIKSAFYVNILEFAMAFVLLYFVLKKFVYCLYVWIVITSIVVIVDFFTDISLVQRMEHWLVFLLILTDLITAAMVGIACQTFWMDKELHKREEEKYPDQPEQKA